MPLEASDKTVSTLQAISGELLAGVSAIETGGTIIDELLAVRTVQRAFVNASASGNTQAVAAQGLGVKIRVVAVVVVVTSAVTVKWQSASSDIAAGFPCGANGGYVLPVNPHGWFQTNANEALNINLSGAVAVGADMVWIPAA